MSVESLAIVLHHSRAKGTAKLVLLGIANHDGDGGAWPSVRTLAKYAACSDSQVQRSVKTLEQLGEVRRFVQAGGDHTYAAHERPNRYLVTLTCPSNCDRTRQHRTPSTSAVQMTLDPDQVAEALGADPVALARPGRMDAAPPGRMGATQTTHITNNSIPKRNSPNRARAFATASCGHKLVDDRHCEYGCPIGATA